MINPLLNIIRGIVKLRGATDNTLIGNVADAIKVTIASGGQGGGFTGDLFLEIARGNILGHSLEHKFGHNSAVGNTNFEDIWNGGGDYPFSASAEQVNVVSEDVNDTSAGTGARTVELFGLDSVYAEIGETIIMNGTTNVLSVNSYLRLQRVIVRTAGSTGSNIADITVTQQTSGDKLADMPATQNQTQIAQWTVPAGKTAYLIDWFFGLKTGKSTDICFFVRPFGEVFQCKRRLVMDETADQVWKPYFKIEEKSDIKITARASTGSHEVSSGYNLILVDNA